MGCGLCTLSFSEDACIREIAGPVNDTPNLLHPRPIRSSSQPNSLTRSLPLTLSLRPYTGTAASVSGRCKGLSAGFGARAGWSGGFKRWYCERHLESRTEEKTEEESGDLLLEHYNNR